MLPILITTSHSSTYVPPEIRERMLLSDFEIRQESDLYTDQIFCVPNAHFIEAGISRLVTDLNRSPEHIEVEYELANDGAVVSITENGKRIYRESPSLDAILQRIRKYHDPFHNAIEELKPSVHFLIDGHSLLSCGPQKAPDAGQERADIVLGNRDFITCPRSEILQISDFLQTKGFSVSINKPYEGKYVIAEHCSRKGVHGIQFEWNRKLYMNEKNLELYPEKIAELNKVIQELVEMIATEMLPRSDV